MTEQEEAEKIIELYNGDKAKAFDLITTHFSVLQTRGHILMTLSGVVVTVSGFSGRLIAGTTLAAQIAIIAGLTIVVCSAFWVFSRVMRINWATTYLDRPLVDAITEAIKNRNYKQQVFHRACILFCSGVFLYAVAFFIMLLNPHSPTLPVR